jgi:hypothetical protein
MARMVDYGTDPRLYTVMRKGLKRSAYLEKKLEMAKIHNYPEGILKTYENMWHDNNARISKEVNDTNHKIYDKR